MCYSMYTYIPADELKEAKKQLRARDELIHLLHKNIEKLFAEGMSKTSKIYWAATWHVLWCLRAYLGPRLWHNQQTRTFRRGCAPPPNRIRLRRFRSQLPKDSQMRRMRWMRKLGKHPKRHNKNPPELEAPSRNTTLRLGSTTDTGERCLRNLASQIWRGLTLTGSVMIGVQMKSKGWPYMHSIHHDRCFQVQSGIPGSP